MTPRTQAPAPEETRMQQTQQNQQNSAQDTFLRAKAAYQLGDFVEASKHAGILHAQFPNETPIQSINGIIFSRLGLDAQALQDLSNAAETMEQALKKDEENPARPRIIDQFSLVCTALCNSLVRLDQPEQALQVIDRALAFDPDRTDAIAAKAEALFANNDQSGAIKLLEDSANTELATIRPAISRGRIALAQDAKPDPDIISLLRDQSERVGVPGMDLIDALRTLGDLENHAGNHENAFSAYRRAANLRRGEYTPEKNTNVTNGIIAQWTTEEMSKIARPNPNASNSTPVLLLGAPCSGVNELGSALGQADAISCLGPIESLGLIAHRVFDAKQGMLRPTLLSPKGLRGKQLETGAKRYLKQSEAFAGPETKLTVDTNPINVFHAGLAALMLPGLKIVLCRRDPIEATLNTYAADLPGHFPYAADLMHAASYVADCNRLMDHWASVLTDEHFACEIHTVQYTDLENDLIGSAQALASKLTDSDSVSINSASIKLPTSLQSKNYRTRLKQVEAFFAHISALP